jgi:hypothetical protein
MSRIFLPHSNAGDASPKNASFDRRTSVTRLARLTRLLIRIIFPIFPLAFAWLSLRNVSWNEMAQAFSTPSVNDFLWKGTIFVYFTSWLAGAYSDVNDQEDIYLLAPGGGRLPLLATLGAITIAACGMTLIYVEGHLAFAVVLTVFLVSYFLGWRIFVRALRPIIEGSRTLYNREADVIGAERLLAVEHFFTGRWQFYRFLCGAVIVVMILGVAISKHGATIPLAGYPMLIDPVARPFGMMIFVLFMDIWLWAMRLRMKATLSALSRLGREYDIRPKRHEQ